MFAFAQQEEEKLGLMQHINHDAALKIFCQWHPRMDMRIWHSFPRTLEQLCSGKFEGLAENATTLGVWVNLLLDIQLNCQRMQVANEAGAAASGDDERGQRVTNLLKGGVLFVKVCSP